LSGHKSTKKARLTSLFLTSTDLIFSSEMNRTEKRLALYEQKQFELDRLSHDQRATAFLARPCSRKIQILDVHENPL
jgi:hypothetical protein